MASRCPMIRPIITRVIAFLLLGALVNIGVAWGSATWVRPPAMTNLLIFYQGNDRYFAAYASSSPSVSWIFRANRVMKDDVDAVRRHTEIVRPPGWSHYARLMPDNEFASECIEEARGWPFLALAWGLRFRPFSGFAATVPPPEAREGIRLPDWPASTIALMAEQRALPLRPLWPGFAINTVFYVVTLWLLFAAPFVLRRRRRIKRGLCPKCAYDLRGSGKDPTACPECGGTLPLSHGDESR